MPHCTGSRLQDIFAVFFHEKRNIATRSGIGTTKCKISCTDAAVLQKAQRSYIASTETSDLERCCIHFSFCIFLGMDLMFNKTRRITAFEARAICASAKHCRRSSGLISALAQHIHGKTDVVAPLSSLEAEQGICFLRGFLFLQSFTPRT